MKTGTLGVVSAANHSFFSTTRVRPRAVVFGLLLSSVATAAVAQTTTQTPVPPAGANVSPGSTNTPSQEQTTQPNNAGMAPAPQASDVANPQTGSTVIENSPQAPQDTGSGLGAIIVTATKRETNLQRTPIAISVANTQSLVDRHAQSLIDLGDGSIPSLRVATFEARQSALTVGIRGIVPFDANQTARDQGVGVYIDGIYIGRQQGLNSSLLDIDRIEVLRGPQGTLFGRNTEGGAVSIITRAPTGQFGVRGTVGVGNYGSREGQLHIDLPAFYNLAIKLDGVYEHQDATVKNPLSGQTGWNYHNVVGGRVAGRWTPVDGLTVDVSYDHTKDENTPNYSQLINYNPNHYNVGTYGGATGNTLVFNGAACNTSATVNGQLVTVNPCIRPLSPLVVVSGGRRQRTAEIGVPQQPSVDNTSGWSGTVKYKLTPDVELRSITGWREVGTHQWDNSGGAHRTTYAPNTPFSRYSLDQLFQHQFSQEFQVVGNVAHQLDYVVGAYYFWEKATELAATPNTDFWMPGGTSYIILSENGNGIPQPPFQPNCPATSTGTANPISIVTNNTVGGGTTTTSLPAQGWDRQNWCVQRDSHARAKSYAAFGQATWTPGGFDIFHLTVGARYTKDKRTGVLDTVNGRATNFTFHYNKSRVDPMVVAAIDATPDIHLYAKYATGFRAGGANDRSATFTAFGPETVQSFEVGSKMDFFNHLARLNLAAYYMRRKGTQTDFDNVDTNPTSPTFNLHTEETRNASGVSKIKGIEADLTVRPVRELTLGASYAYTDIKVPPTANPFLPGNPLFQVFTVYTPKNAASGFMDYELPTGISNGKLRLHLDANYAGRQYSFQAENVKTDSSFIVNGRIALADVEMNHGSTLMTFALWSRNLLDETHIYRRSAANSVAVPVFANGAPTQQLNYGGVLGDYGNFNPPRTWGAEISFKIGAPHIAPPPPPPMLPPPPATVTCESGTVITAPGICPQPPAPPPPPAPAPERGY
jgi:iron complex outermembrane receptor protein